MRPFRCTGCRQIYTEESVVVRMNDEYITDDDLIFGGACEPLPLLGRFPLKSVNP